MTTSESRDKLDSTLTPKLLTYSKNEENEELLWCVFTCENGGPIYTGSRSVNGWCVGCKPLIPLALLPREGGGREADLWGQPASHRMAGLGIVPCGTALLVDGLD